MRPPEPGQGCPGDDHTLCPPGSPAQGLATSHSRSLIWAARAGMGTLPQAPKAPDNRRERGARGSQGTGGRAWRGRRAKPRRADRCRGAAGGQAAAARGRGPGLSLRVAGWRAWCQGFLSGPWGCWWPWRGLSWCLDTQPQHFSLTWGGQPGLRKGLLGLPGFPGHPSSPGAGLAPLLFGDGPSESVA